MSLPRVVVVLGVETRAVAYLICETFEEQQRLALDLSERDVLGDVLDALAQLSDVLAGDSEEAS